MKGYFTILLFRIKRKNLLWDRMTDFDGHQAGKLKQHTPFLRKRQMSGVPRFKNLSTR